MATGYFCWRSSKSRLHTGHWTRPASALSNVQKAAKIKRHNRCFWAPKHHGNNEPTLRLQVCPKKGISPTIQWHGDGIETINPTNFQEGSGFLGMAKTVGNECRSNMYLYSWVFLTSTATGFKNGKGTRVEIQPTLITIQLESNWSILLKYTYRYKYW